MNDKENRKAEERRIRDKEAAAWLVMRDRGFTPDEQDAFFQWLGENPEHGENFAELRDKWEEFDLLAQWLPEHSEEPNPDLLAHGMPRRHWGHWRAVSAIAASFVMIFFIWAVWLDGSREANGRTEHIVAGDYGYHVLEDGSELDMNRGAEVLVEYSKETRLVKLLTGEVHFTVAKNPERPFVVRARGADVRAVGTAFNVLLDSEKVEVLVTEGKVRMEHAPLSTPGPAQSKTVRSGLDLVPGQRSVMRFEAEIPSFETDNVETQAMAQILAWKHETLDFNETPLVDAVLEFNRRNEIQVVIEDKELESEPIGATFRSNNLEGFVNLLETIYSAQMEVDRSNENQIVLRKL